MHHKRHSLLELPKRTPWMLSAKYQQILTRWLALFSFACRLSMGASKRAPERGSAKPHPWSFRCAKPVTFARLLLTFDATELAAILAHRPMPEHPEIT